MHKGLVRDVFSINFKLWTAIASASNKPAGIKNYKQSMNFIPHLTSSLACNSNSLNEVLKNRSTKKENWFHLAAAILSGGSLSTVFQIKMKWEIESWEKKNPKNNDGNQYKPQPQAISSIPRLFGIWSVEFVGEGKPETQVKKNLGARMKINIMWFQVWEWQTPITVVLSKHSHPCTIHHSHTYP